MALWEVEFGMSILSTLPHLAGNYLPKHSLTISVMHLPLGTARGAQGVRRVSPESTPPRERRRLDRGCFFKTIDDTLQNEQVEKH